MSKKALALRMHLAAQREEEDKGEALPVLH